MAEYQVSSKMGADASTSFPNGFKAVCRLCLGAEHLESIFKQGDLRRWLWDYISVVIDENDTSSRFICVSCQNQLREFRDYQKQCLEAQNVLLSKSSTIVDSGETVQLDSKLIKKESGISVKDEQRLCRLCLSERCSEDVYSREDLVQWISSYLSIAISDQDKISRFCCTRCQIKLKEFHDFKLRCLEVQSKLQNSKSNIPNDSSQAMVTVPMTQIKSEVERDNDSGSPLPSESDTKGDQKDEQSIECKVCHKIIKSTKNIKDSLRYHMVTHGPRKHACTMCDKTFVKAYNLKEHMKTHIRTEEDTTPVECDICHKMLKNKNTLRSHKPSHGPKKHVCSICGKAFALRQTWKEHMGSHKGDDMAVEVEQHSEHPFVCNVCHKIMKSNRALQRHMKFHGPKKHSCSVCGEAFVQRRHLKDHMATHVSSDGVGIGTANPFKCDLCPRAYKRSNSLQMHKKTHDPEKHVCLLCNKVFHERRRLSSHLKVHDKNEQLAKLQAEEDVYLSDHEPYECELCPKIFHFEQELSKHMRNVHKAKYTGMKESDHRKNHIESSADTETTEYPFKCKICRRGFKTEALLLDHFRKVRAKMSYECSICKKRFISRRALDLHVKDAIHAEAKTVDNKSSDTEPMYQDDLFEADDIKIEPRSDSDDDDDDDE